MIREKHLPVVSIIVPVFKVERYIEKCIDSILSQSFNDFELILIDDGSPDNCGSICDYYTKTDNRIIVIHIPNSGVSHARNIGLECCNGKYVTFVDSDDYCDSNYLFDLVDNIQSAKADLVQSGYWVENEADNNIQEHKRDVFETVVDSEQKRVDHIINHVLFHGNGWEVWSSIFLKEVIQKKKIRFCETCENFAEDLGFMLEYLLYCNRVASIGDSYYYYVKHSSSMMEMSRDIVRLNPLNEIGVQFGNRFLNEIQEKKVRNIYPLIYHLIMSNQYYRKMKLKGKERRQAANVKNQINNIEWHDKWMRRLIKNRKKLVELYGKKEAAEKILTSRLLANRNWYLFKLEKLISFQVLKIGKENGTN